jgi:CHASE3 domain sensor protein
MEQDILQKFESQEKKLEEIYKSVEKMRKYFLWTLIVTVATIVLPLIALVFIIPWFLGIMSSAYGSLGL